MMEATGNFIIIKVFRSVTRGKGKTFIYIYIAFVSLVLQ